MFQCIFSRSFAEELVGTNFATTEKLVDCTIVRKLRRVERM